MTITGRLLITGRIALCHFQQPQWLQGLQLHGMQLAHDPALQPSQYLGWPSLS